jgi:beta-xylosidase
MEVRCRRKAAGALRSRRRRWLPIIAAIGWVLPTLPAAAAANLRLSYTNPLVNASTGAPILCPDPGAVEQRQGQWRYFLVCTSSDARDAFPIWKSKDLVHWTADGFVFPYGAQPSWATHTAGSGVGHFWAPQIYYRGRWVVYFAAAYDPASNAIKLPVGHGLASKSMVIGVATARTLQGPWRARILHYRGQFDAVNREKENSGSAIDPSVVREPRSGRLYLFWVDQMSQVWEGKLSTDGLKLDSRIHKVLSSSLPWERDPDSGRAIVEGPAPFYANGLFYLFYSVASTWNASYAVGVARSAEILDLKHPFKKLQRPLLSSSPGFFGPGGASQPITGPDGSTYVLYHAMTGPRSKLPTPRVLMLGHLSWIHGWPMINGGLAH